MPTRTLTRLSATTGAEPLGAGTPGGRRGYRYDLDGLRGLAIGLVAVFHIWFGRVSGGVDVFLTLSGFFFGASVLRHALTPGSALSPRLTIERLVRRLVPALVVVLAASAVLTVVVQPQTRWETFADQSLASLGYYQNWELAATASNYLRAGEAVSPLQHIWSMSVQGQFYLTFLLLVLGLAAVLRPRLGANRLRTVFVVLFSALTLASFVYAIVAHRTDQISAYYNSAARAWELLLGVLIGALVPRVNWPTRWRAGLAGLGLATILSCGALIDGVTQFPGPMALAPVGGAVLLILAGANRGYGADDQLPWPNRLLASRQLVRLGALAYALYLWHWPLLIFWLAFRGSARAGFVDGLAIVLLSALLADLTLRFVEEPLRRGRRSGGLDGVLVTLLAVALTAGALTWRGHIETLRASGRELTTLPVEDYPGALALLDHDRVPELPFRPTVLEARDDVPESTDDGCISDFDSVDIITCTYGDRTATRSIALAGGSHAEHWITALDILGHQHHFRVVTYLKMGCPLTTEPSPLVMGDNRPYPKCREWNDKVLPGLIADRPDFVFTTSTRPWNIRPGDTMPSTYIGVWAALSAAGIPILAMRDTPWLVRDGKPFIPADCLAKGGNAVSCGIDRPAVLSSHNQTLDFSAQFPLLKPLDLSDAVCRADYCRAVEGNVLIYHDAHHISTTYMRSMTPELGRQLGAATGWW